MTATEELRALLDARGVEWDYAFSGSDTTMFRVNGIDLTFTSMRNGLVCSTILTPAQAVEAMLGRGECRIEHVKNGPCYDVWRCSACGYEYAENVSMDSIVQNFCPNCGRRVTSE